MNLKLTLAGLTLAGACCLAPAARSAPAPTAPAAKAGHAMAIGDLKLIEEKTEGNKVASQWQEEWRRRRGEEWRRRREAWRRRRGEEWRRRHTSHAINEKVQYPSPQIGVNG